MELGYLLLVQTLPPQINPYKLRKLKMIKVVLHTEQHPEDNAMLQALYSRSAESVTDHINKLKTVGSGKFMSQYYLGYGHASIADCGFITLYIEGVSMLAAKAIQDNPLYNGQESSSRYIDWSFQPFYNPYEIDDDEIGQASRELLQAYREFYTGQKPLIIEHLKQQYPIGENEKSDIYEKAITAKAFDILRGFLPCGATTNVSWTTSLRKANEHLSYLATHPLKEVRDVAQKVHATVLEAYPNSIAALPDPSKVDPYTLHLNHYYTEENMARDPITKYGLCEPLFLSVYCQSELSDVELSNYVVPEVSSTVNKRPRRAPLLKHDQIYRSRADVRFMVDFGSYRDLQRHRGGYCSLPIIKADDYSFHPWYYEQLPEASKKEADRLFNVITEFVVDNHDQLMNQYILPMGNVVPIWLNYDIHQMLYVAELRSSQTVHATLRPVAQAMGKFLESKYGITTYCDYSENSWNLRRGSQDITSKLV
jgi:thymidylate synthase ThyX